jgi:hypothetical protein
MSSISLSFLSCSVSRYADIFLTDGDDCWTTARLDDTSPLILFEKYWKLDDYEEVLVPVIEYLLEKIRSTTTTLLPHTGGAHLQPR